MATIKVKGHTRKDGTKVSGYTRRSTRRSKKEYVTVPRIKQKVEKKHTGKWRKLLKKMGGRLHRKTMKIKTEGDGYVTVPR